jgi:predicted Zn-ribbon and HTH transcriptional regulator
MEKEERIKALMASLELTQTGYAGVDKKGNKVDRRQFPSAVPFAKSTPLNIPHPRCIKCGNEIEATYLIESICPKCRIELPKAYK